MLRALLLNILDVSCRQLTCAILLENMVWRRRRRRLPDFVLAYHL